MGWMGRQADRCQRTPLHPAGEWHGVMGRESNGVVCLGGHKRMGILMRPLRYPEQTSLCSTGCHFALPFFHSSRFFGVPGSSCTHTRLPFTAPAFASSPSCVSFPVVCVFVQCMREWVGRSGPSIQTQITHVPSCVSWISSTSCPSCCVSGKGCGPVLVPAPACVSVSVPPPLPRPRCSTHSHCCCSPPCA